MQVVLVGRGLGKSSLLDVSAHCLDYYVKKAIEMVNVSRVVVFMYPAKRPCTSPISESLEDSIRKPDMRATAAQSVRMPHTYRLEACVASLNGVDVHLAHALLTQDLHTCIQQSHHD